MENGRSNMVDKRSLDFKQLAALRFPDSTQHFASVREAIAHWHGLEKEKRDHAVLVCEAGDIYQPPEIPHLEAKR
jgi:hypothetical protein